MHKIVALALGAVVAMEPIDQRLTVDVPKEIRNFYYNFTRPGSCVQASIGIAAVDQNVPAASTLLWDTEYGHKEWHGSGPARVAAYARERNIRIYNITGSRTYDWMKWAIATGRGCAIGAGTQHFQTLMGYNPKTETWYVCNNNSPSRIDEYSNAAFHRLHEASGRWIVILDYPPHPARPEYATWWE
jgi:hypothetical protein